MAKRLKDFTFPGRGRPVGVKTQVTRHPWEDWFDGSIIEIRQGEDFAGSVTAMRSSLYRKANEEDVFIQTAIQGDAVIFRAIPLDEV